MGLPLDKTLILSVGRLIPVKGFDLLIQALKILTNEFHEKNLYLVIVGEGTLRNELEKLTSSLNLKNKVSLVGAVSHKELYLWYNASDLFCLPSSREGWPNVLLESLICGKPVVATEVCGIPEIIQSDRIGILTECSVGKIAEGILNALKRSWDSYEIIQYAREKSWHKTALRVYQEFTKVINKQLENLTSP